MASHLAVAAVLTLPHLTFPRSASAKPGTHPIVVSTWDTRASSVVLQYRRGLLDGGGFHVVSYNANFSATSGKLSSQFGLHYLSLAETSQTTAHGLAATAAAVFNFPLTHRFDNGLPIASLGLVLGSAPTALVSGERNFVTVPLVLGLAAPTTPAKVITLTPWFELAPSLNLDTIIKPYDLQAEAADWQRYVDINTRTINFTAADVERILSKSVELDTSAAVGARGGLDLALHASDGFDFVANATLSSVGTAFSGTRVWYLGGGFAWRWDDIVPAVLPPDKRLQNESCEDIEQRFRGCPNSRRWHGPEEMPTLPATTPPSIAPPPIAPPAIAPPPVAPGLDGAPSPATEPPGMTGNGGNPAANSAGAATIPTAPGSSAPYNAPAPPSPPPNTSTGAPPEPPPMQSVPTEPNRTVP